MTHLDRRLLALETRDAARVMPVHLRLDALTTEHLERLEVLVQMLDAGIPIEELATDDLRILASVRIVDGPAEGVANEVTT